MSEIASETTTPTDWRSVVGSIEAVLYDGDSPSVADIEAAAHANPSNMARCYQAIRLLVDGALAEHSETAARASLASPPSLTFAALRAANMARLPLFKNRRGERAHSQPDGSDWSLGDWSNAVLGELGEAANLIKKIQRGDRTLDGAREELAKEFADVVTYLDILAFRAGVDLGDATAEKWDEVSARVGVALRIADFAPPRAHRAPESPPKIDTGTVPESSLDSIDDKSPRERALDGAP